MGPRSLNPVSCDRLQRSTIGAKPGPKATAILSIDLAQNWTNASVQIHPNIKPDGVPNLNYGSLWYDESTQLLYTGYTGTSSSFDVDSRPLPPPESIWTFRPDNLGGGTWNLTISSSASVWNSIKRMNRGYEACGNGSAYVLDGTDTLRGNNTLYSGMIKFDMSSEVFSNISSDTGATSPSGTPSWNGAMQYVPSFGPDGVFVVMGGGSDGLIDFGYVEVYDPASGLWYNQTTTGSKPSPRVEFCTAGAASANDTYEIFVYAGDTGNLGTSSVPCDTVNILSLPAFHWISVAYNPQNPRAGHTCEAVGGSQIAIIGGFDANPTDVNGDYSQVVKSIFSTADPFVQGLAIFDLRTLDFAAEYIAGGGAVYEPNEAITQFYTQVSYSGNLVEGVAQLMKETHFPPSASSNSTTDFPPPTFPNPTADSTPATSSSSAASNSTSTSPSSSSSANSPHTVRAGAIAGGVIGGLLGIALLIALVLWLSRRRRRRMQAQLSRSQARGGAEIDGNARAELQQPFSRLELGYGEAHEKDGIARGELGHGEAHEKDGNAVAELPG